MCVSRYVSSRCSVPTLPLPPPTFPTPSPSQVTRQQHHAVQQDSVAAGYGSHYNETGGSTPTQHSTPDPQISALTLALFISVLLSFFFFYPYPSALATGSHLLPSVRG